jgi:hypothetical protein
MGSRHFRIGPIAGLAQRGPAGSAEQAVAAHGDKRRYDVVAGSKVRDVRPNLAHNARRFVAHPYRSVLCAMTNWGTCWRKLATRSPRPTPSAWSATAKASTMLSSAA